MRSHVPVLVVGAGPTGLLTALELRRRGIDVELLEVQRDLAGRSYALALHAATVDRLRDAGIDEKELVAIHVDSLTVEGSPDDRISIDLEDSAGGSRRIPVVPQASLERILRDRLAEMGTEIRWHHRLAELEPSPEGATAGVERIETGASGFTPGVVVALVAETFTIRTEVVVGADGHNSTVRRELQLDLDPVGERRAFAIFDVEAEYDGSTAARIFLFDGRASTLWPLGGGRWRWTLEVDPSMSLTEPRFKSRSRWEPAGVLPRDPKRTLERLVERRIPWHDGPEVRQVAWSTMVSFDESLAKGWGAERCWLVGDAAHLWTPLGIQSMNLGLQEAVVLAEAIAETLHSGRNEALTEYGARSRRIWEGLARPPALRSPPAGWLQEHAQHFPGCLPASGPDLDRLLETLGFEAGTLG